MTSHRELLLQTLYKKLSLLERERVRVFRNLDKPMTIKEEGFIILRDGKSQLSETLLSPLSYVYEHFSQIEIIVQNPDSEKRHQALDAILIRIGQIIQDNRSLEGLAEWVEAEPPEFIDEPIEGAPTMRIALLSIMFRFETSNPLG